MNSVKSVLRRISPLSLTVFAVLADQITKYLVVKNIPLHGIGWSSPGELLRFIFVYNTGIAFSIGHDWPYWLRMFCFVVIPVMVIIAFLIYVIRPNTVTELQRWALCGVCGGGFGNFIDRIFRPEGVVDFIDVKFFGIFGMERWPTFNLADSFVLVFGVILVISFLMEDRKGKKSITEVKDE